MSSWALWDRAVPVLAVLFAAALAFHLGRALERIDWLSGKRRQP